MKKSILFLAFFLILGSNASSVLAATDTLIRHDSVKVYIDRIIIENPDVIKSLTAPFKISTQKKICGWGMILSGVCAGTFSIVQLTEGGRAMPPNYAFGENREKVRQTGIYQINICFSAGLIAAGASMLLK
jgi:hypothetical protein